MIKTHFLKHTARYWYFAKHKCVVCYKSKAKLLPFPFKKSKQAPIKTNRINQRGQQNKMDGKHDGGT